MYIYEFEFFEDNGMMAAFPFGLDNHATQGIDLADAIAMAADLVKGLAEDSLLNGHELPEATFGHEPEHGGKVFTIAVSASLDDVETMTASHAAEVLGVSRGRVSNMLRDGVLEGFRKGRDSFVTRASVEQRLKSRIRPGRPSKETAAA
ncbi:MAG: helix-turn-helix domain-containing protein [Coriobacteriales bacterium]|jgi:excisionase family DNA binding protein|nr:helix-turn-helix domain-containing protein [Coriobacteriales bacterium]